VTTRGQREDWELQVETCSIELWRGYLTASFIARVAEGEEAGAVVESSSSFRWRSSHPPDTEEAKLAHYEILALLKASGWSPRGEGGQWYETELARPTLVPPRPAPAQVVPAPVEEREPPPPAAIVRETPVPETLPPPSPQPIRAAPPPVPVPAVAVSADRWRIAAFAGLAAAIAFLVLVGLHG
jgi:hypothetical protein